MINYEPANRKRSKLMIYFPFFYFFTNILIACGGQTFSHAKQNIQSFSRIIKGFFSDAGWPGVSNHS